jgi:Flp pilus assembly protein TadD
MQARIFPKSLKRGRALGCWRSMCKTPVRGEIENYLRKRPNDPAALARLAMLQQRDGNQDQAIKTCERLAAEHPFYAPATRQLALLYGPNATDVAKAYDWAEKARKAYPDDPEVAKTLGILSFRRRYYPRSLELLKEAAAKRPDDVELLFYIAKSRSLARDTQTPDQLRLKAPRE